MRNIKYIFFDCMETLIDLDPLPTRDDYALWAYRGSGVEHLWPDYAEFLAEYHRARERLTLRHGDFTEDGFSDRFALMCAQNPRLKSGKITPQREAARLKSEKMGPRKATPRFKAVKMRPRQIIARLCENFMRAYYRRCFVHEDVRRVLPGLADRYKLGIVSNFKSRGGIETMLKAHGLARFFAFTLVSINFGRRKPHPDIYREAIRKSRVRPEEILFVGDDIQNDIIVPESLGMRVLLLDRHDKHDGRFRKITSFRELEALLK
jgi:putative hydrolase of the HAD superfamily